MRFVPARVVRRVSVSSVTTRVHLRVRPLRGATHFDPLRRPASFCVTAIVVLAFSESLKPNVVPRGVLAVTAVRPDATRKRRLLRLAFAMTGAVRSFGGGGTPRPPPPPSPPPPLPAGAGT